MLRLSMRRQAGVTLTELMVGLTVGLLVTSGVLSVYLSTIRSSSDTLRASYINQDMGAAMNIMLNDIRRAGYWGTANITLPENNPFSQPGTTALAVFTDMNGVDAGSQGSGSCIVYAYDSNQDGVVDNTESFGFRLNGTRIEMRTAHTAVNTCNAGTWEELTDDGTLTITTLTFDLAGSKCLNTDEPDEVDDDGDGTIDELEERDCYAPGFIPAAGSTDRTVETREVLITLVGQLANDADVELETEGSVRVRNDLVRVR